MVSFLLQRGRSTHRGVCLRADRPVDAGFSVIGQEEFDGSQTYA
jgi:hypothetical protein